MHVDEIIRGPPPVPGSGWFTATVARHGYSAIFESPVTQQTLAIYDPPHTASRRMHKNYPLVN